MTGAERERSTQRGKVLAGLVLTMGLSAMDATIVATAIPSIVRDLGGFSLFAWVFSIYLLVQAVSIPVYGRLADLYGRKPVLVAGALIFLLGSVLSGFCIPRSPFDGEIARHRRPHLPGPPQGQPLPPYQSATEPSR